MFKTTPREIMKLATIMVEMEKTRIDPQFIVESSELARTDQGIYDLMALWLTEGEAEREKILDEIKMTLADYQFKDKRPKTSFDRYLDKKLKNPEFAKTYTEAQEEIAVFDKEIQRTLVEAQEEHREESRRYQEGLNHLELQKICRFPIPQASEETPENGGPEGGSETSTSVG